MFNKEPRVFGKVRDINSPYVDLSYVNNPSFYKY